MSGTLGHVSDSASDVNKDSEHRTRLTGSSSKIERNTHGCCFMTGRACFEANAIPRLNLHQRGELLSSIRVPEVDPPAGAAEGRSGEQRTVRREVTGGQEVEGLTGASCQVPDECVRAQTPETYHLTKRRLN